VRKYTLLFIIALITITSCATKTDTVLSDTASVTSTRIENTISANENIFETLTETTTIKASTVAETTVNTIITEETVVPIIDDYNAADYNPLYIDFNQDGVDEVIYRIPENHIRERVCIEINDTEYMFPDLFDIYFEYNSQYGVFTYSYSDFGYLRIEGFQIPDWSYAGLWVWHDTQFFKGLNDSCQGPRQPAAENTFYDLINNNDLSEYYSDNKLQKFELNFYNASESIGCAYINETDTQIKFDKLNIAEVEENIKVSNSKNYSVTTFDPDQMFLYKRQRLLNPDYDGADMQTEEQTEYMLLSKSESDNFKVVDGIFLGTKREDYVARYCRYLYNIQESKYTFNDMGEGSNAEVFNNAWESVGEQSFEDRWELVREVYIVE
jgi:hypothetical protein